MVGKYHKRIHELRDEEDALHAKFLLAIAANKYERSGQGHFFFERHHKLYEVYVTIRDNQRWYSIERYSKAMPNVVVLGIAQSDLDKALGLTEVPA